MEVADPGCRVATPKIILQSIKETKNYNKKISKCKTVEQYNEI